MRIPHGLRAALAGQVSSGGDPYFNNVSLLLHGDGTNGSTTFVDSSSNNFTITDGAGFEVDPGNGSVQLVTLGANRTPQATNFAAGESVTLMVADGTAYTLTWTHSTWGSSGVAWVGGSAPTLATTGYTVLQFWKVGTQIYGASVGDVA